MTSVAKTTIAPDTSALVDGQTIDAADVLNAVVDARDYIRDGRVSVTAADTHVKHVSDAVTVGTGLGKSVINAAADEALLLELDSKLQNLLAFLNGSGLLDAANGITGILPGANGGLGANAAAFSGLIKMAAGVASAATANTDYLALSGAATVAGKTLDATNDIRLGAIDRTNAGGASSGDVLAWNGMGYVPSAPGGGGAQPVDITITAGEDLAERDFVFLSPSDNKVYKLDADATTPLCGGIRGVVNEAGGILTNGTGTIRILGEVSGYSGLTAWGDVYASTTAGGYTQTKPTVSAGGGQKAVIKLGFATSTTKLMVRPEPVQYLKRESLANDASLTIVHHSDPAGRGRRVRGYVGSSDAGASLASYASSNQDSNVALSSKTINTYTADQCTGGTPSASTEDSGGGQQASKAFDDSNSTQWYSTATAFPNWIRYQFASGKTIRRYTITGSFNLPTYSPKTWVFEGSNDGSTWTTLDTQTSVANWTATEKRTYNITNSTSYTYYRLYVTATEAGGSNGTIITEIEMMEVSTYTDGATKLAQSFQVSGTQTVDMVKLWLKKVASPTGTMTLRIETDSAGSPSGTLADAAATVTVAESSLSTSYGWITFNFASNFNLSGSTTYWLVLSTSRSTDEFNYVQWGADGSSPGYASGQMKSYAGSWSAESKDAVFDVVAVGTTFDEPCVVGRASGGTRDLGARFDDGAGANGDTKTTFTNKSGGTLDVTCIVELS